MARSYNERQRPTINTLASNPVQYEVHLIGIENSQPVVIVGHIHCDLALAIASAWFSLSEWVKGDPVWRKLWILRSGAAFETREGTCAIKGAYYMINSGRYECMSLLSGEHVVFSEDIEVREIQVAP